MAWNRNQRRIRKMPTDVYRVYGADGVLLYVGIAVNVFSRMREHRQYAPWWPYADTATVHRYPDRASARMVEARAIEHENPLMNITQERAELRKARTIPEPIEVLSLFWEDGKVWVDAEG